jgi:hypothetical protein
VVNQCPGQAEKSAESGQDPAFWDKVMQAVMSGFD